MSSEFLFSFYYLKKRQVNPRGIRKDRVFWPDKIIHYLDTENGLECLQRLSL